MSWMSNRGLKMGLAEEEETRTFSRRAFIVTVIVLIVWAIAAHTGNISAFLQLSTQ